MPGAPALVVTTCRYDRKSGAPARMWRSEPSLGPGRYTRSGGHSLCLCQLCFVGPGSAVGASCLSWVSVERWLSLDRSGCGARAMPVSTRSNIYSPELAQRACLANTFASSALPPWTAEDAAEPLTRVAARAPPCRLCKSMLRLSWLTPMIPARHSQPRVPYP